MFTSGLSKIFPLPQCFTRFLALAETSAATSFALMRLHEENIPEGVSALAWSAISVYCLIKMFREPENIQASAINKMRTELANMQDIDLEYVSEYPSSPSDLDDQQILQLAEKHDRYKFRYKLMLHWQRETDGITETDHEQEIQSVESKALFRKFSELRDLWRSYLTANPQPGLNIDSIFDDEFGQHQVFTDLRASYESRMNGILFIHP